MAHVLASLHGFSHWLVHAGPIYIVALSILVFVHEFGHFWVARRCGVKIEAFSIGFGGELFFLLVNYNHLGSRSFAGSHYRGLAISWARRKIKPSSRPDP